MGELMAPFACRVIRRQDAVHGAFGAKILPFVEQGSDDLGGRAVDEAWADEHVEDMLAFASRKCPGGRLGGLLAPGSGLLTTVERSPGYPQRLARRRDADV